MEKSHTDPAVSMRLLIPSFVTSGLLVVFGISLLFGFMEGQSVASMVFAGSAMVVIMAVSLTMSFFAARTTGSQTNEAVNTIKDVSKGNLERRMKIDYQDQIGAVAEYFNKFMDGMQSTVVRVADSSKQLSFASNTLDATGREMLKGVEEIVSEVSSVATASEEMASTSMEIARNCTVAAKSSAMVNDSAVAGENIIQGIVVSMDRIGLRVKNSAMKIKDLGGRSDQVGEIAAIINDIADQTNLLALNAAIEAARAGEHGRGFAVVADEVRKLAERTAQATKDIGTTIRAMQSETKEAVSSMEEGVREAEAGVEETEKSGNALKEILHQVNTLTSQINQIAVASEQQTATTNEITGNIQRISEVMGQASVNIHENSGASTQVANLSSELYKLMGKFNLEGNRKGPASGNPGEAMELVKKASQYFKTHGKDKAFKEFNNPRGMFTRGELYIFCNDLKGVTLAHGQNAKLIGKNVFDLKDIEGKYFIKEMTQLAEAKGSGWVDYKWKNPATGDVLAKSTYCMRAEDVVLGCGIYK
jgi:methyl-accepting chemotaxis protein